MRDASALEKEEKRNEETIFDWMADGILDAGSGNGTERLRWHMED